jgi:SAM-dependent methyltransferase
MIAGRLDESGIGRTYTDDFLGYVDRAIGPVAGLRILEIGSGTGYLLHRLAAEGADTVGVEPGEHSQDRFSGPNVLLLRDFFPTSQIDGKFDVVIMYNVLEHVATFADWFEAISELLSPGGRLLISVPACDKFLDAGDPSILVHEHFSYFTSETLGHTLAIGGFGHNRIEPSGVGRSWYVTSEIEEGPSRPDLERITHEAEGFRRDSIELVHRISGFLSATRDAGESVGIYVPLRAINAIVMSGAPIEHCRFFDDDTHLQGCFLPGAAIAIEARDRLLESPTDHVLIMSESFGEQIRNGLAPNLPTTTRVLHIGELHH